MVRPALPVLDGPDGVIAVGADPSSDRRIVRRDLDRRIAIGGAAIGLAFIVMAMAAIALGGDTWMALHLLLAGAGGASIGAVMPFFAAALAAAPPATPRLRIGAIVALTVGAATVAVAVPAGHRVASLVGAGSYLVGAAGLAASVLLPVRRGLAPGRALVVGGYLVATAFVLIGVSLVTAMLLEFAPVTTRWTSLKPAHAWLNLIGFVGLTVAATMIHLLPTVLGARIVVGRLARSAIVGLAVGVEAVAAGFAVGSDPVVRAGAVATVIGAFAVPGYVVATSRQRGRGRWTTDLGWHRFTTWTLKASAVWFAVGVGAAAAPAFLHGATPSGWSLAFVGVPFALGSILQALLASATHLLPTGGAIAGDGSRMRGRLGWVARPRVVAYQIGVVALWGTVAWGLDAAIGRLGALLLVFSGSVALALLAAAIFQPARRPVPAQIGSTGT
jgi:nitrite reductase (NO-forming)